MYRFHIGAAVLAAFSAFAAVPAQAALVDFSFSGEVSGVNTNDVFFSNLFPLGTSGSGHLILDYDGDPATAVINSFSAMLGLTNFSMADGAGQEVLIANDVGFQLQTQDRVRFDIDSVLGPNFFGHYASYMYLELDDATALTFSTDTPSALELTGISGANYQLLHIFFENALGEGSGSIVLTPTDRISVDVISPVPLPGALGLALSGLVFLGAMSRLKKRPAAPALQAV